VTVDVVEDGKRSIMSQIAQQVKTDEHQQKTGDCLQHLTETHAATFHTTFLPCDATSRSEMLPT